MNVSELFDLHNRVALVTGGAQGLGYEMAEGLAEAGADLVICALDKCEEAAERLSNSGRRVLPIPLDIAAREAVESAVAQAVKTFGRIDILMNNAGINALHEIAPESFETWERIMAVNISGAFLCAGAVGQVMKRQRGGSIVNTGSIYGLLGVDRSLYVDNPEEPFEMPAYTASKGAIVNLTRDLAVSWARYNIRVNCICPATFVTDQNRDIISPETLARLKKRTPLGRTGEAGDLKGVAVFLASEASRYITGQVLAVDGGWTAW
jgi:gluconate 5-dehydrogenase